MSTRRGRSRLPLRLINVISLLVMAAPLVQPLQAADRPPATDPHAVSAAAPKAGDKATSSAETQAQNAGIDLGGVMETVRHYVDAGPNDTAITEGRLYRMRATPNGFDLTLRSLPTDDQRSRAHPGLPAPTEDATPLSRLDRAGRPQPAPAVRAEALPFDADSRLGISLQEFRVGRDTRTIGETDWRRSHNTVTRNHDLGLTERVTAHDGHVKWDFILDAAPRGDISIKAEVSGGGPATRVTKPAEGDPEMLPVPAWRFGFDVDRAARIGEMVVVDADGRELLRALPEVADTKLRMQVPAASLAKAAYPVTIDPAVSPEYPASDPAFAPDANQSRPSVAWNGSNFLVAWEDYRSGETSDVYGTRMSAAGAVLDPAGIAISTAPEDQLHPSVASNGTSFLIAWTDYRSAPAGSETQDIYGTRVSADGTVLNPGGIAISTASGEQERPAVSSDGTNYLVAWEDDRLNAFPPRSDIYAARVNAEGAVLDPAGIAITTAPDSQNDLSIAWNGTSFLVVWLDWNFGNNEIFAARVNAAGTVLDPAGIAVTTKERSTEPSVASDGTNFLVVFRNGYSGTGEANIHAKRVSATGEVLDHTGIAITTAPDNQYNPSAAWNGTNFLVVWEDYRSGGTTSDIYGTRVSSAGEVRDPTGIATSTAPNNQYDPLLASDGTNFLVVWEDYRSAGIPPDIYGTRVSATGAVLDPTGKDISTPANDPSGPSVAWNGTNFLIVWTDDRSGTWNIYGARVSGAGAVLDEAGIAISEAANNQGNPTVAWNGTNFLVAWSDNRWGTNTTDVYGARVSAAGTVLDPDGFAISTAPNDQSSPAVAWNGTNFLIVWDDHRSGTNTDIYGARVSAAGTVLDPDGIAISTAAEGQRDPAVAWNGTNFLVVWQDFRSDSSWDIYGTRVTSSGAVVNAAGIAISTAANNQLAPSVASNSTNFLVAWNDARSSQFSFDIYGTRVSATGSVLNPGGIAISTAAGGQFSPSVAWNGTNFLVAWGDFRSGPDDSDIYGTRVSAGGTVLDSAGIGMATSTSDETRVNLVAGLPDSVALVYRRTAGEPPDESERMFVRFYDDPSNDPFASPRTISGNTGSHHGMNRGATEEAGEPEHAGNPGGTSVWYAWTPSSSGAATLTTVGSSFDTLLAVYTGSTLGDLSHIASNDDFPGGGRASAVSFDAVGGTTYRIAVDGFNGESGVIQLNVDLNELDPQLPGGRLVPVAPTRFLDTRDATGGHPAAFAPQETFDLQITGRDPIPASGVSAIVVNITVTEPTEAGFVTVWPSGTPWPGVSNLNFTSGQTIPNLATVEVGPDGTIAVFNSSGTTHIIIDVLAYYDATPTGTAGRLQPLTPDRILDTRDTTGGHTGKLTQQETFDLQVTGRGGIPATGVSAVVLNLTVTDPTAHGHLAIWPTGTGQPNASNLNFTPGLTAGNRAVVKVGDGGKISIFNSTGDSHVIVDVGGWYTDSTASPSTIGSFAPLDPVRLLDSRDDTGGHDSKFGHQETFDLQVSGRGDVPATGVSAVVVNITVTDPTAAGFITVWPTGAPRPTTSDLNFTAGTTRANLVIAKLGPDGKISIHNSTGESHVIADVVGWYRAT